MTGRAAGGLLSRTAYSITGNFRMVSVYIIYGFIYENFEHLEPFSKINFLMCCTLYYYSAVSLLQSAYCLLMIRYGCIGV